MSMNSKDGNKEEEHVKITVAFDMGWNNRSSGHKYGSRSGHVFIIDTLTGKIVGMHVIVKPCRKCKDVEKNNVQAEKHNCPKNYEGSLKSMEVQAILQMVI